MQRLRSVVLKCAPSSSLSLQLLVKKEEKKHTGMELTEDDIDLLNEFGPEGSIMQNIQAEGRKIRKILAAVK
jgi:hypothetical protein